MAVAVGHDLDFDVARIDNGALQQHRVVAEGAARLRLRRSERRREILRPLDQPHAAPAAARRRLDHHGIADGVGAGLQARSCSP